MITPSIHNEKMITYSIIIVRELKHARFWHSHSNRKWAIFYANLPSHNHIHIASIFSPLEMSSRKIWETIRSQHAKCFLPVAVRDSKNART